jgi:hypothetical protein
MLMASPHSAVAVLPQGFVSWRALWATFPLQPVSPCKIDRSLISRCPRKYSYRPPRSKLIRRAFWRKAQAARQSFLWKNATSSPLRPNTLVDALPLIPGVIRTPDGRIQIAGLDEEHSSLLINSVSVNDPATGNFGLSVPIDSVGILKVMQSPFLGPYGNFIAGIVSAETLRGGAKFSYSLNDPIPESRIRSGHLVGLQSAPPRLNLSGPLIKDHLYFLEGFEYLMSKSEVRTLPFPVNVIRSNAFNSFTQIDELLGAHSITVTLHFAPHSDATLI